MVEIGQSRLLLSVVRTPRNRSSATTNRPPSALPSFLFLHRRTEPVIGERLWRTCDRRRTRTWPGKPRPLPWAGTRTGSGTALILRSDLWLTSHRKRDPTSGEIDLGHG